MIREEILLTSDDEGEISPLEESVEEVYNIYDIPDDEEFDLSLGSGEDDH